MNWFRVKNRGFNSRGSQPRLRLIPARQSDGVLMIDMVQTRLRTAGIETAILYPEPIHLQPAYRGRIASAGTLSVTEKAARELLCLPVHPAIDQAGLDRTVAVLLEMFHG